MHHPAKLSDVSGLTLQEMMMMNPAAHHHDHHDAQRVAKMPSLQVYDILPDEKLVPFSSKAVLLVLEESPVVPSSSSICSDDSSACSSTVNAVTPEVQDESSQRQDDLVDEEVKVINDNNQETREVVDDVNNVTSESPPSSPRKSILKRSSLQEIPLSTRKSSWKQLPMPDLEKIRCTSCPAAIVSLSTSEEAAAVVASTTTKPKRQRRSSVTFDSVHIREYNQTVGDNPSVSYGPPIGLDWQFQEIDPISLNDYEDNRGKRRNLRQMMMNYYHRRKVLMWIYGFSEEQVNAASHQADQWKRQRAITNFLLPCQKVEELLQSAQRKAKRFQERRKSITTGGGDMPTTTTTIASSSNVVVAE